MQLFDYQEEGINFIKEHKKIYLAFDMGMGKTLTSLSAMIEVSGKKNILVIAEKNEIVNSENFRKEVETHFEGIEYYSLRERSLMDLAMKRQKFVAGINPDGLVKLNFDHLRSLFSCVIIDEATLAKTTTTVRFKKVRKVCEAMEYVVLLSGTPMMNGASEIFAPLVLLGHPLGGDGTKKSRQAFETIFAGGFLKQIRKTGVFWKDWQWWAKGANHVRELRWLIKDQFIFKSKNETTVFKSKDRGIVNVPMTQEWIEEYEYAWDEYLSRIDEHNKKASKGDRKNLDNIKELQKVIENGQVYQVSSRWKAKRVVEDIANGIYGDRRIIIYSMFLETDQLIQSELEARGIGYRTFDELTEWKQGTEPVLVGRIKSHAKGGNVPQASVVLFVDMDFVPANNLQAENRIDRPEQTRDMIIRYYMGEGEEMIDRHVQKVVKDKMTKIQKFMGGFTKEEQGILPTIVKELQAKYSKEFRTLRNASVINKGY